ncbi:MAG: hypothetical protein K2X29_01310 [Candidatus Obscuribacterales bacterium]|nr:hypothetical protein [Candidatus Obscuribacterales bacterium]
MSILKTVRNWGTIVQQNHSIADWIKNLVLLVFTSLNLPPQRFAGDAGVSPVVVLVKTLFSDNGGRRRLDAVKAKGAKAYV